MESTHELQAYLACSIFVSLVVAATLAGRFLVTWGVTFDKSATFGIYTAATVFPQYAADKAGYPIICRVMGMIWAILAYRALREYWDDEKQSDTVSTPVEKPKNVVNIGEYR